MANEPIFVPPTISDADVLWACRAMGLPDHAFSGAHGNDPRLDVLKSTETLDVEACPGSGKTTLLVAKLAILANTWQHRRQGICVLSHTNAARNEIEKRLGGCAAGKTLLRYPHFVGTIHSFVNEFLAVPWLRSRGYTIRAIDTEIALNLRWKKVPPKTKTYLKKQKRDKSCLVYGRTDFGGGRLDSLAIKEQSQTYKTLVSILKTSSESGYFCHDEMFVWANQLLDSCPNSATFLRLRFPLLFLDEVQDNSESQSALLNRVFFSKPAPVLRQRFGDSNQAIFEGPDQKGAKTDLFPAEPKKSLPNSFRFGQKIADAANPLGVHPQGLKGTPPGRPITALERPNVLFLFDEFSPVSVLPAYAKHLIDTFSAEELSSGTYTAVAHRHTAPATGAGPRGLRHYAPAYDPQISRKDDSPSTFLQYVSSGRREIATRADVYPLVSRTAAAVLRLAQLANTDFAPARRSTPHRQVLAMLEGNPTASQSYLNLVGRIVSCAGHPSPDYWNADAKPQLAGVAGAMAGCPATSPECNQFLEWSPQPVAGEVPHPAEMPDNLFRYPPGASKVQIRLGSIHSVKGETHTATLVLDSSYHGSHLENLKPWLLGARSGGQGEGPRMLGRLRLHYVAMTRPSCLLCLAMRRQAITADEEATLADRGWRIVECPATDAT